MSNSYNTIFEFSQKELSQDAFLAWFFQFADKSIRKEYIRRFSWKTEENVSKMGECATDVLRLFTGIKDLQPETIEIYKQREKIDLWVDINGTYSLIIEDKTGTSEHSNQLTTYKNKAQNWCSENKRQLFCVYYKTETFTMNEKKDVENKGYFVFTKNDVLNIFRKYMDIFHFDDIFASYYEFINNKDCSERSFISTKLDEWKWYHHVGFFHKLDEEFNEKHNSCWSYVHNQNGGFCGFWWHFTYIDEDYSVYLQFEDNKLVIKVGKVCEQQSKIRKCLIERMNRIANEMAILIQKPPRYGCGKTMTLGIVDRKEWYVENSEGYIDFEETKKKLEKLTLFIDKFTL